MTGDVLLIKQRHKTAASALVDIILEKGIDKPVIAISGESGSGKSELSHCIGKIFKSMGKKVKVVTTDDFYKTLPSVRTAVRLEKGIAESVGPQEYDWDAIGQVVDAFKNNKVVTLPCVDLINDQVDRLTADFKEIEMLIFDGLYAIKNEEADLRIFIDIPYTKTKMAQLKRGKEPMDPIRLEVLKTEHEQVCKIKGLADYRITGKYLVKKTK